MDNSKVLKPIIGPQESEASKKKEGNKKKKALLISALAFLIATGTIAGSIAVVKANMPKLEIKFDDWFVDSFDFDSMQAFIDENRLSKGDIDKKLPGYVDKKAKDQNVKNADMITNARLTNKIPENNTLPHGIYVEMTAEVDYAFTFQADLSLEDNNENTKELSSIADAPKKQRYFISKDKSKLYVLVYERESDSDESLPDDLQTFNDFKISNCLGAFQKINNYIAERNRRYTQKEFENESNWKPALELFTKTLIGLESQYVDMDNVSFDYDETSTEKVMKIKLKNTRSNFTFTDQEQTNGDVSYDEETGFITVRNLQFFSETELQLDTLQDKIQEYIVSYNETTDDGRYTREEFLSKMGDETLLQLIAKELGVGKEITPPEPEPEQPENPDSGDTNGTNPLADPVTHPNTIIDTSKIKYLRLSGNNLVIDLNCDEKEKYTVPENMDADKYIFDQVNDRLTVKGLNYYTEINITNTDSAFNNIDAEIVKTANQYTVSEFKAYAEGVDTQETCKELIAKGLRANGKTFDSNLIKKLTVEQLENSETKANLIIEFDTDFKKYKTNENEQLKVDRATSTMKILLTFFKKVEMNNLKNDIQSFIKTPTGQRYTVEEFEQNISEEGTNDLKENITKYVTSSIDGATNVTNFQYDPTTNELTFNVTIKKYDKFPSAGDDIKYELLEKNADDTTTYKVIVSNLQYFFDFEITDETLLETKKQVENYIIANGVTSSDQQDDNNYPEHRDKIYKLFGEATLKNGMKLSDFMTDDANNFKLEKHKDFYINLNTKFQNDQYYREYLRNFTSVDGLTGDGIELKESDKILKFNNFEFSTIDKYFVLSRKKQTIYGVSALGLKATALTLPKRYHTIDIAHRTNVVTDSGKTELSYGFYQLKTTTFIMPDDVETITKTFERTGFSFLEECHALSQVKLSKNIKTITPIKDMRFLWDLRSLKQLNIKEDVFGMNIREMPEGTLSKTSLDHFLLPRYIEKINKGCLQATWYPQYARAKYIITWAKNFMDRNILLDQSQLTEFYFLSNDLQNLFGLSQMHEQNKNKITYYVISEEMKQQVRNYLLNATIVVNPNIEQELIDAGKIPSDW